MDFQEIQKAIEDIPDEVLAHLTVPWQSGVYVDSVARDSDGAPIAYPGDKEDEPLSREALQTECWNKFTSNPMVSTSVRGLGGRITGMGFESTSEKWIVQQAIEEIEKDIRNRLYHYWPRYVVRALVEGELVLILTLHTNGFVEVDFLDPANIDSSKGDDGSGIIFHSRKRLFPLFYCIKTTDRNGQEVEEQIPSINIAWFPDELIDDAKDHQDFDRSLQKASRPGLWQSLKFKSLGGYRRFIVAWDRGYLTRRAVSYLRTVLEWLNHYETLKKYEIDHKKSSGNYCWTVQFEDVKAFRLWVSLSDEERRKTAMMAKITPGSKLFLPPGCKLTAVNPQLPKISDEDTDILQMGISGLNEAADVTTGTVKGTYASVKATRGPMSDRTSDEVADFERFLKFDFWKSVFFLRSKVSDFPEFISSKEAVEFDENGKPVFQSVPRRPEEFIDVQFPISETLDLEARSKAVLGVKHGPLSEVLGIPKRKTAKMVGIGGYGRNRLRKETEDQMYPEIDFNVDAPAETGDDKNSNVS